MVFSNDSDNPRAPAFRLMYSPPQDGDAQRTPRQQSQGSRFGRYKNQGGGQSQQQQSQPQQQGPGQADSYDDPDDDIPF